MKLYERNEAIMSSRLTAVERMILIVIASRLSKDDETRPVWMAAATIAERAGCATSTAQEALERLEAAGVLRASKHAGRSADRWIDWSALSTYTPEPSRRGGRRPTSPNIGDGVTEHRCSPHRTSVTGSPNIGEEVTEDRRRSVQDPSIDPSTDPDPPNPPPPAAAGGSDRDPADGRPSDDPLVESVAELLDGEGSPDELDALRRSDQATLQAVRARLQALRRWPAGTRLRQLATAVTAALQRVHRDVDRPPLGRPRRGAPPPLALVVGGGRDSQADIDAGEAACIALWLEGRSPSTRGRAELQAARARQAFGCPSDRDRAVLAACEGLQPPRLPQGYGALEEALSLATAWHDLEALAAALDAPDDPSPGWWLALQMQREERDIELDCRRAGLQLTPRALERLSAVAETLEAAC